MMLTCRFKCLKCLISLFFRMLGELCPELRAIQVQECRNITEISLAPLRARKVRIDKPPPLTSEMLRLEYRENLRRLNLQIQAGAFIVSCKTKDGWVGGGSVHVCGMCICMCLKIVSLGNKLVKDRSTLQCLS